MGQHKPVLTDVHFENSRVRKRSFWNISEMLIEILAAIIIISGILITMRLTSWTLNNYILMIALLAIFYSILIFILSNIKEVKLIKKTEVKTYEQTVDHNIPIEVIKKVIVEKPVIQRVMVHEKRKKLNIPHYNYIGSNKTKTFHTRFCRLGKLVKKKYKIHSNQESFFFTKKYKPCKVCILKEKKI